jgi:hypothetical protein
VVEVGDNPLRLATKIDAALVKYRLGSDRSMRKTITEPSLIAECPALRRPADG